MKPPVDERTKSGNKTPFDIEVESLSGKRSLIIGLAWPALAESILASLVSMVDMIMVGALGAYAIGAVGLVTQPRFVMLAAFMALNVGSTAMVSRFKGARDKGNANQVLNQSLIMTMAISLILSLSMFFGGEGLIRFLAGKNISEEMIQGAHVYLRIQVYGFPTLALTFTINAVLRGVGNTRAAFYNNAVSNLINVFFNYCLISGNLGFPGLGIAGASLATVIGQCAALGMALSKVLSGKEFVRLEFKNLAHMEFAMIRRIAKIGVPAMVEQLFLRIGMMLFTIIITSLGDHSYAAHMIAMNLQQISFMTCMAFGTASSTLTGQCLGRLRADLAKVYVKMTQNLSYIVSFLVAILLFFGGELISSLYTKDTELAHLAANMLKIIALVNPISNARFIYVSALRGAGDSRFAAVITFVGVFLIRPLLSLILVFPPLPFQLGLAGVWIALSSDGVACYFLARSRFLKGKWAGIKV
ncbi:MAG: MATE family efflux transporter [Treponema sp.]|jgi:putative MATE family efflux protein|nr:MATE family efflux transporter [Treponema sp.]